MTTYIVSYERFDLQANEGSGKLPFQYRQLTTEEVTAGSYVPLPQKVVNFYKNTTRSTAGDEIIATYYDVVSVKVKTPG